MWADWGGGAFIRNNASNEEEKAAMNVLLYLLGIFCFLAALVVHGVKNEE